MPILSSRPTAEELKHKSIVNTFLIDWVKHNDQSSIEWLLAQTSSGFDRIHARSFAVIVAVSSGNLETLKWLVKVKRLSLDVKSGVGDNPVLLAAWYGHLKTLKWLVKVKRLSLDVTDNNGNNPVLNAASNGQLKTLKWLGKRLPLNVKNKNGNNPVLNATWNGQLETLKWLVKRLSLDVKDIDGDNPVLLAALRGKLETLKWLVDVKGLSLDVKDFEGDNPVLLAACNGKLETLKWLVDVKSLLLDVKNDYGNNPVLLAALNGHLKTLKWLVDVKGLSLDVKNNCGNNPVLRAAWNGHLKTLKWLVDVKGLSLDVKNNNGSNPVLYAAWNGQLETLKWLIDTKKYSFNVSDNNACQILLEQSAKFKPEIFTYAFPHFLESLYHANHLKKALEVTEKQYGSLTEAAQRNQLDVEYEKFIDLNYPNPAYKTCLESYGRLNKTGALQCHISLLLRNNKPIEANALCLQTLQGDSTAAEKECAAINLAELIFQQNSDLIEEGSPLEGSSDPFLSADQSRIKRAIQAFYLLKDYQCEKALHLKQRLDQVLSGNNGPSGNTCSEKTWKERAFYYYAAYLLYKNNPRGEHLDKVMQRFTNESSQLVSKNSFFGSKNTPEKNACRSTRRLSL